MEAFRFIAKPVNGRIIIDLPVTMDADHFEVIVIQEKRIIEKKNLKKKITTYRTPPAALSPTIIHDDLIAPASLDSDWDVLQ